MRTTLLTILLIIIGNIFSAYFWIRLYKELFHTKITIKVLITQGFISALSALGIIRFTSIQALISKVLIEESTKTLTSEVTNKHVLASDHIVTAVLAGIGFAVIENIIYIYYLIDQNVLQISLMRLLSNSILHALFTGCIGFGIYQFIKNTQISKKYIYGILFVLLGITSHTLYNYFLQSSVAIGFIFVIVWYFFLSYFLYKSDRLFLD